MTHEEDYEVASSLDSNDRSVQAFSNTTLSKSKMAAPNFVNGSDSNAIEKIFVVPGNGEREFARNLKKALKEKNLSYTGNVTFELMFSPDNNISGAKIISGGNTSVNEALLNYVKSHEKWTLRTEEKVEKGIYFFSINL